MLSLHMKGGEDKINWEVSATVSLRDLMIGNTQIINLPWKPALGERYYSPNIFNSSLYGFTSWNDNTFDNESYKRGLVCKTKDEAINITKKMLAIAQEEHKND